MPPQADHRLRTTKLRAAAGLVLLLVSVAPVAATAASDPSPVGTVDCAIYEPFDADFVQAFAARYPAQRFTAAVYDRRTGCEYDMHRDERITTASVFKVEVMAGALLRAQEQGRSLTAAERSLIGPMITESANAPTSQLFLELGGPAGFAELHQRFGLVETSVPPLTWGLTLTSARDQVSLIRQVLLGEYGPLAAGSRAEARSLMTSVVPTQTWGITAGVEPRWTVAQKNGFAGSAVGWRVNSVGFVEDLQGSGYAVAILSVGWGSQAPGVAAVEEISRQVAATLAPLGAPPGLPFVDVGTGDWFYGPAVWAFATGVTAGTSPLTFDPLAAVTRGQAAAFLARAFDLPEPSQERRFVDTAGSIFAADAQRVREAGISYGCNPPANDAFCPEAAVTRGQWAAMVARALDAPVVGGDTFIDDDASVFEANLESLAALSVIRGCNPPVNDRACPASVLTRAEVVAFLHRIAMREG